MRKLIGCLGGLMLVCFSLTCVSGIVIAAAATSGTAVASAAPIDRIGPRQDADPSAAAAYDDKVAEFARKLATTPPGGPPATLKLTRSEVTAKLASAIKQTATEKSPVPFDGLFLDFQAGRLLATIQFDALGRLVELRCRLNLIPTGDHVRIEIERVDLAGLLPFAINVTDIFKMALASSGTPLDATLPFSLQSLQMEGGTLTVQGLPK